MVERCSMRSAAAFVIAGFVIVTMAGCGVVGMPKFEVVKAEAVAATEAVTSLLPENSVTKSVDKNSRLKCGDGPYTGDGTQFFGHRWITVPATFDRKAWLTQLAAKYKNDGWTVKLEELGKYREVTSTAKSGLSFSVNEETDIDDTPLLIVNSYSLCGSASR